jgi:DNA-binding response OmpR family regulator
MKAVRILVAEDDPHIRQGLADTLLSEDYEVVTASDGAEALALFQRRSFDLVLLDIMMPKMSGYDVCREIRALNRHIPILMLTAKGEEIDKVVGLRLGADDYITKPFGIQELLARIAAALRRARVADQPAAGKSPPQPDEFRFGRTTVNVRRYTATSGRRTWDLTDRELRLLLFFHSHPGEVLTRDALLNAVWGVDYLGTTRTLDQHMAQLRKKVEETPANPKFITTVHGVGYRYEPQH